MNRAHEILKRILVALVIAAALGGPVMASEYATTGGALDQWAIDNLVRLSEDAEAAMIGRFYEHLGCWQENTKTLAVVACRDGDTVKRYIQERLPDVVTLPVRNESIDPLTSTAFSDKL